MKPQQLRASRRALGYSTRSMAKRIGVAYQTISNWENGHTKLPYHIEMVLKALAIEDKFILRKVIDRFHTQAYSEMVEAHRAMTTGDHELALAYCVKALRAHARNPADDILEALQERIDEAVYQANRYPIN